MGSAIISLPTISFCWLPPDSAKAATSGPGVRTSNSSMISSVRCRDAPPIDEEVPRERAAASGGRGPRSPRAARRAPARRDGGPAGCSRVPARDGGRVLSLVTSLPSSSTLPVVGGSMPTITSMSSSCPLPSTPAMPTISPRWTSRPMSLERGPARLGGRSRSVRASATWSPGGLALVSGEGSSLPTISSASSRAVTSWGSTSATVRPARMTVIASATDSTSSSLWEMKITVTPPATSSRREAKSSSTSWGTSTAVGSSRMMMRAPR